MSWEKKKLPWLLSEMFIKEAKHSLSVKMFADRGTPENNAWKTLPRTHCCPSLLTAQCGTTAQTSACGEEGSRALRSQEELHTDAERSLSVVTVAGTTLAQCGFRSNDCSPGQPSPGIFLKFTNKNTAVLVAWGQGPSPVPVTVIDWRQMPDT